MLHNYFSNPKARVLSIKDGKTKIGVEVQDGDKKVTLTFSDVGVAQYLGMDLNLPREKFLAQIKERFSVKTGPKIPIVNFKAPVPEEWRLQANMLITNLDGGNRLGTVNIDYLKSFNSPLYAYTFCQELRQYYASKKSTAPLFIERVLTNPTLELLIESEPFDKDPE